MVESLKGLVAQSRDWQRLKIEKFSRRHILFRQDEMAERDWENSLGSDPTIRNDSEEILRRERLKDGDKHLESVLLFCELLLEKEELVVQDHLRVDVLDEDPETFRVSVNLLLPLEIWSDGKLYAEGRSGHRLDVTDEVQFRELVNVSEENK